MTFISAPIHSNECSAARVQKTLDEMLDKEREQVESGNVIDEDEEWPSLILLYSIYDRVTKKEQSEDEEERQNDQLDQLISLTEQGEWTVEEGKTIDEARRKIKYANQPHTQLTVPTLNSALRHYMFDL